LRRAGRWRTSSKLAALRALLEEKVGSERTGRPHRKAIVFSQWTRFLDMVQLELMEAGIGHVRYDGAMTQRQREAALERFRRRPEARVFVMSLRASGVGLNLTEASLVVLADPWWNPAVEAQAIGRVHRIGQLRRVEVARLVCPRTVEDRMVAMQEKKRAMVDAALSESDAGVQKRLSLEDLKSFFV
jgi:DNA repair protein RAD16